MKKRLASLESKASGALGRCRLVRPEDEAWLSEFWQRNFHDVQASTIELICEVDQREWAARVRDIPLADFIDAIKRADDEC